MAESPDLAIDFHQFATITPDLACVATLDGYFAWVSPSWEGALGYTLEDLKNTPFFDLLHPDDVEPTVEEMKALSSGITTMRFVNRYRHAGGRWIYFEWMARLGSDDLIYAWARDITERRLEQEERMRQHELWQLTASLANLGYWKVNVGEGTLEWSDEVYEIHGVSKDVKPVLEEGINAYHPEDRARVAHYVDRAIRSREPFDFRLRIVRPDGEIRQVRSVGRCETENDEVVSLFGVFQDITEDVELRQMNESLEQFTYVASHDLKEPVRTVLSFTKLVERDAVKDEAEKATFLGYIREAAERMRALIDDLLEFSQLGQPGALEEFDLNRVVADVLADLAQAIEDQDAELEIHDLPRVEGDRVRYQQLFSNLMTNAIKFRGTDRPRVVVSSRGMGPMVEIRVADNGIGIAPEFRGKVIRPFQRLHTREEYEGTGIGLSIVQRIVEQNGGVLSIEEGLDGSGTSVVFTLPMSRKT